MDIVNDSKDTVTNGGILPTASVTKAACGMAPVVIPAGGTFRWYLMFFFGGIVLPRQHEG